MKKVTKIAQVDNPLVESAKTVEEYGSLVWDSLMNPVVEHSSPPVEYWIAGDLVNKPEIGRPLLVQRKIRNGVECDGVFCTSPIVKVAYTLDKNHVMLQTKNSIYLVEDYLYDTVQ